MTLSCLWGLCTFDSWVREGLSRGVTFKQDPENTKEGAMQTCGEVVEVEDSKCKALEEGLSLKCHIHCCLAWLLAHSGRLINIRGRNEKRKGGRKGGKVSFSSKALHGHTFFSFAQRKQKTIHHGQQTPSL